LGNTDGLNLNLAVCDKKNIQRKKEQVVKVKETPIVLNEGFSFKSVPRYPSSENKASEWNQFAKMQRAFDIRFGDKTK
jgi:hypothetical protein